MTQAWLNWIIVTTFVLFQFLLQTSASVMTVPWMQDFALSHFGVGMLSAAFFYAYVGLQIPVGLLYTRYGSRKILTIASCLLASGCFLLAMTANVYVAFIARIMMGSGAAFGFVGMLFTCAHWFSVQQFVIVVGLSETIAMLSVALGSNRLGWLIEMTGWRPLLWGAGMVATGLIFASYFLVRDKQPTIETPTIATADMTVNTRLLSVLIAVLKQPSVWLAGLLGFCLFSLVNVFSSLWGVPFLQNTYHLDVDVAASMVSMLLFGVALGCATIGWIAKFINRLWLMIGFTSLSLVFFSIVVFVPRLPHISLYAVIFASGIFTTSYLYCFAIVKETVPEHLKGVALAVANTIVMAGAPLLQSLIGYLLETDVLGLSDNTALTYRLSLGVLPVLFVVALWCILRLHRLQQGQIAASTVADLSS